MPKRTDERDGGSARWWILAVIGAAQLIVVLDATIVTIALPSAQADLGFDDGDRTWIVTAYALAFGSLLLPGGRIADLAGRRAAFLVGLAGFSAASALGGAAGGFAVLVTARALQGAFGAVLAPAALSLLATTFTEGKDRARAFAIFGAIAGSGSAIGLLLGGMLTEYLNWRWTLYVNLVFAAVAMAGAVVLLPRAPRDRSVRLDVPGTVLASAGLFALVYGFATAERHGWSSGSTRVLLGSGVALLAVFFCWQARARHPLLPPRIVTDRDRAAAYLSVGVVGAALFAVFLFLTYFMQQDLGYSPIRTGLAFLPMVAALMASSGVATSLLADRWGAKVVVPAAMAIGAGGLYWLTGLDPGRGYAAGILGPLLVIGVGCGGVFAPAKNVATYRVEPRDAGVAAATLNTTMQVGGSIGTALLSTVAATAVADYLRGRNAADPAVAGRATLHGYATVYAWGAVLFAVGAVLAALLFRRLRPEPGPEPLPTWTVDPWRSLLISDDAYRALPRNVARTVEIVDGRVVYCEASPPDHEVVSWRLAVALRVTRPADSRLAVLQGPDVRFIPPVPLADDHRFTLRRPDIAILRSHRDASAITTDDVLAVVEIAHPNSLTDFADKRAEYAFARIPVYLIVVMTGGRVHSVEEYRLDWSGRSYQVAAVHNDALDTELADGLKVNVPLAELTGPVTVPKDPAPRRPLPA
ncbi:hypothetical protein GCM10027589_42050 [Actinocorallia lasiicapitis]